MSCKDTAKGSIDLDSSEVKIENLKVYNKLLNELIYNQIQNEGMILENKEYFDTTLTKSISLINLVGYSSKFVLVLTNAGCSPCNASILRSFANVSKKMGVDNTIIFVSIDNYKELIALLSKLGIKLPISIYSYKSIIPQLDAQPHPYCMIIKSDLIIEKFFIPTKVIPVITDYYFNSIEKYFITY
ncbi:MAG: hypothetical protein HQ543_05260 [Bacteroidetes bacterium]|nr:hypothetical protein [Bacteroidota bacterium]